MGAQCVLQGNEQARRERYAVRGGVGLRCKKMPVQSAGETTKEKAEPGTRIASRLSLADLRYKKDISTNVCSSFKQKKRVRTRIASRLSLGLRYKKDTRHKRERKGKIKTEPGTRIASRLSLVPVAGVEPAPCCQDWILSPARLPIPSHRQNTFYIIQDLPPKSKQKIRPSATRHKKFVCRAPRIATWPLQTNDRERRPPANEYRRPGFSSGCSCV